MITILCLTESIMKKTNITEDVIGWKKAAALERIVTESLSEREYHGLPISSS